MHFNKSSLVPHPQLKLVNKFGNLNSIKQWNLFVNDGKTEYTKIHVATKKAKGPDGKPLKGNEPWRSSKLLGSLLCSNKDIDNRCNKGWQAFTKFEKKFEKDLAKW